MINNQKVLGLITARGGSKRLPNKNLADLGGTSLLGWTVKAALGSQYLDKLIISSDSQDIIAEAEQYKCEAPFIRPDNLAGDDASSVDVALHALNELGWTEGVLVLLQPTSPFRQAADIDACLRLCQEDGGAAVVSVTAPEKPAVWLLEKKKTGFTEPVMPLEFSGKGQGNRDFYFPNGAVFVVRVEDFLRDKTFWPERLKSYPMERSRSVDIDTAEDLDYARYLLQSGTIKRP